MLNIGALRYAASDNVRLAPQALDREAQLAAQFREVVTDQVTEFDPLEVVPDAFIRVELRRVGGEPLQLKPSGRSLREQVLDWARAVDRRPVPQDEELAREVAEQMLKKTRAILASEGMVLDLKQQAAGWRDRTDDREMIAGEARR